MHQALLRDDGKDSFYNDCSTGYPPCHLRRSEVSSKPHTLVRGDGSASPRGVVLGVSVASAARGDGVLRSGEKTT